MSVTVTWINHASFRIAGAEAVLYIDPWKLTNDPHDGDVVFVSHSHPDHFSLPDIEKVSNDETCVIASKDIIVELASARAVVPAERISIKDVTIETVAAYNISKEFHPQGNQWCGAVFTIDSKRIYYAGDTDLIPEMSDLKDVDLALLPVGGTYTLDAEQAAQACEHIGCKMAVPYHWGDIVGSDEDADRFAEIATCQVRKLQPGQSVEI